MTICPNLLTKWIQFYYFIFNGKMLVDSGFDNCKDRWIQVIPTMFNCKDRSLSMREYLLQKNIKMHTFFHVIFFCDQIFEKNRKCIFHLMSKSPKDRLYDQILFVRFKYMANLISKCIYTSLDLDI